MKLAVYLSITLAATLACAGAGDARADDMASMPPGMAGKLIAHYHMQRVPQEGVWFSLGYVSEDTLAGSALPERYANQAHAAGSAIFVVATDTDFSALHCLQTDETWHWYGGAPLELLLLNPDGHGQSVILGNDVWHGQTPQFTVPHGVWQGAAPIRGRGTGRYSFAGTQLSPAFDARDFAIGYRDQLQTRYPAFRREIEAFTRIEFATAPTAPQAKNEAPAGSEAHVFNTSAVPVVTAAPGVSLQELVGRLAPNAGTASLSVARFSLAPGTGSGKSFNHRGLEILLVTQGQGQVLLDREIVPVERDSVVYLPPGAVHEITAAARGELGFYAITVPAFSPEDYVPLGK